MNEHRSDVHVIRKLNDDAFCPDKRTCPAALRVTSRPGFNVIVGKADGAGRVVVPDVLFDGLRRPATASPSRPGFTAVHGAPILDLPEAAEIAADHIGPGEAAILVPGEVQPAC